MGLKLRISNARNFQHGFDQPKEVEFVEQSILEAEGKIRADFVGILAERLKGTAVVSTDQPRAVVSSGMWTWVPGGAILGRRQKSLDLSKIFGAAFLRPHRWKRKEVG